MTYYSGADIVITFATMYVHGWICQHDKTKPPDPNDLKLGTGVVLNTLLKPIDFGFKRSRVRDTGSSFQNFAPAKTWQINLIIIFYKNYFDNIKVHNIVHKRHRHVLHIKGICCSCNIFFFIS